ncbi:MAG: carboxypeptidase-like regulatory domain-containing protein, partial [Planctomycetota bacterium]
PKDWTGAEPLFLSTTDVVPAAMVRAHVEQENFLVLVTQSLLTGVSGRVVDEHGNAVSEFDLELYWDDLRVSVTEWKQPHAGGEFALQLKRRGLPREGQAWDGQLDVMAPGRRTLKLLVSGVVGVRTDLGVLRLEPPAPVLSGVVLDGSTGGPIEGAEVGPISMVRGLLEGVSFRQSEEIVWTDSEGRFSTAAVSLTGERLVELRVWAEGYAIRHIELGAESPSRDAPLRIELGRGSALTGFARDAQGLPVEGVTVRVFRQAPSAALQLNQPHGPGLARTREDGAFSFEHLEAGTWILGYGFTCLSSGNLTGLTAMRQVEVPADGAGEPIELLVDSGCTVRARVRMGEQFPAQASLGFVVTGPLGQPVALGQLATGRFQLVGLSPGRYTLRVIFGWGRYLHDVEFQLGTVDLDLGTIDLADWYSSARREMQEELAGK